MDTTISRFFIGLVIVALAIFAVMMAQSIGESFGHGIVERLVP